MSKRIFTTGLALAGVLALAACSDAPAAENDDAAAQEQSAEDGAANPKQGAEAEMPEADTSDIPEVVAEVNGEEITGIKLSILASGESNTPGAHSSGSTSGSSSSGGSSSSSSDKESAAGTISVPFVGLLSAASFMAFFML